MDYLWISLGGAIGTAGRYWLSLFVSQRVTGVFPLGTMLVNISGCFIIGLFAGLTQPDGRILVSPQFRLFFTIGLCGGYTTFSSFSLQTLSLAQDGEWLWASLNVVGSVVLCLAGVWLGHVVAMVFNR